MIRLTPRPKPAPRSELRKGRLYLIYPDGTEWEVTLAVRRADGRLTLDVPPWVTKPLRLFRRHRETRMYDPGNFPGLGTRENWTAETLDRQFQRSVTVDPRVELFRALPDAG